MSRILILAATVFGGAVATALPVRAMEYGVSTEWVNVWTSQQVRKDSPYNPGNQLALLASGAFDSSLRLDLRAQGEGFKLGLGPRLAFNGTYDLPEGGKSVRKTSGYLQRWQMAWQGDALELFYNRELMLWGPSLLASPSNPFFRNVNQTNPMIELPTRDFVGTRYQWSDKDRLGLIVNVGRGRDTEILRDFKPTVALTHEHTGEDFVLGNVLSVRKGTWRVGSYGQYTLNDATLLYGDAAWFTEPERLVVRESAQGLQLAKRADANQRYLDVLLGGSYTFTSEPTLNVEYRYNGAGYSARERRLLGDYAQYNAALFTGTDPQRGATALGRVVTPFASTWSRQYLNLQYTQRFGDRTSVVGIFQYGLDAHDSATTLVLSRDVGEHVRLMANAVFYGGSANEAGRRYIKRAIFLGARITF